MVSNLALLHDDILTRIFKKIDNEMILKLINFNDTNINKIIFNEITNPPLYFGNYSHAGEVSYISTHSEYKNNNDKNDKKFNCCNCSKKRNDEYFRRRIITREQKPKQKNIKIVKRTFKYDIDDNDIINSCSEYNIFNFCGECGHLFRDDMLFYPAFRYIYY
jgi:hypothetical protein